MKRARLAAALIAVAAYAACDRGRQTGPAPGSGSNPTDNDTSGVDAGSATGANPAAVAAARANLLANLLAQMSSTSSSFLFGHERYNVTGVNPDGTQWLAVDGSFDRSDVNSLVGDQPALTSFDAWDLAIKPASWTPTPKTHADAALAVHDAGGIVAMEFHMHGCAVDSFDATGNEACLCQVANDDAYARSWLIDANYKLFADALVAFGLDQIPIIFRPLHEQNGDWFWWGEPYWSCASYVSNPRFSGEAAYQRVYQTIVTYLRVERGLNNLLIAYSPAANSSIATSDGYLTGYPGDEYIDVLGGDYYYQASPSFADQTTAFAGMLQNVTQLARTRGKVAAATEVGNTQLAEETDPSQSTWFSQQLLPLLQTSGVSVAYATAWENRTSGAEQFWVPYPGNAGDADFESFIASGGPLLRSSVPPLGSVPPGAYPVCLSCASADSNGDGWGWENNASCRLGSWCLVPQYPPCQYCASADANGDGWGWENGRSCVVLATCE
jgi:mannan endo-1,4-beta-mannosidase